MNNTVKILAAFVVGSAMGIAAGLMMAPTTGKQARKKLGKKSRKLAKKLAGMVKKEQPAQRSRKRTTASASDSKVLM